MTQTEFNDQWSVEDLPACDTGMELLKHFSDAHAEISPKQLRVLAWSDFVDDFIGADVLWQKYSTHVESCPHCNDV